jgi:hypothetical protein
MFESIGKVQAARGRRGLAAWLVSAGVNGGALGLLAIFTRGVEEAVAPPADPPEAYIPITLPATPAPSLPKPSPSRPKGGGRSAATPPTLPFDASATALPDIGPPLDLGVGPGDGPPDDLPPGGDCTRPEGCGETPASGRGPEIRTVHWSEVKAIHRPAPEFPKAAIAAGVREAECIVMMRIDGEGRPTEVSAVRCDEPFFSAAREAALDWRFEPFDGGGEAKFRLSVKFRGR